MAHGFHQFLETRALERFDEDPAIWFQGAAKCQPRQRNAVRLLRAASAIFTMRAMELSERQRKYLRGLGHALNPVLLIGTAGVTPAVIAEAKRALARP